MRSLTQLGLAALTVAAMGCDDDRTSTLTPIGDIAIGASVGPAPFRLPSATVAVGASATVTAANLRAVTGAGYHFWYVSRDAVTAADVYTPVFGSVVEFFRRDSLSAGTSGTPVPDPITGDPITVIDSNVVADSTTRTGTYAGTNAAAVYAVRLLLDSAADVGTTTPLTGRNAVVVSLGSGTTSDAMFLFRRTGVAGVGAGAMSFGNFGGADLIAAANPADYVFAAGGTDTAGTSVLIDTLRSAYNTVTSQSRVSLFDADVNGLLPGIAVTAITNSQVRNCAAGVTNCANTLSLPATSTFAGQASFILTLNPKGSAAALGETVVLVAAIPDRVW